jgi:hypothetical protein
MAGLCFNFPILVVDEVAKSLQAQFTPCFQLPLPNDLLEQSLAPNKNNKRHRYPSQQQIRRLGAFNPFINAGHSNHPSLLGPSSPKQLRKMSTLVDKQPTN